MSRLDRDYEVVLVSYRSRNHVETLLAGWPAQVRVAIVDNSRGADGLAEVAAARPRTRYLDGGGEGFARAANLGALSSEQPYVVFVNPDSRPSVADLDALVAGVAAEPESASHAATMLNEHGSPEVGVGGWEPSVRRALVHNLHLQKFLRRAGLFAQPRLGERLHVDWTTGACMAVRTETFRRLGGFDDMFYVYLEDVSFGRRVRLQKFRQVLRDDVTVLHGAGRSGAPSQEMLRLRGASYAYYLLTYHPYWRAFGIVAVMVCGHLLRAGVFAATNPAAAGQYVAFAKGLVSGRANVGGAEVARARYLEVSAARSGRA